MAGRDWTQPRDAMGLNNSMRDTVRGKIVVGLEQHGFRTNVVGDTIFAYNAGGKFELTLLPGNYRVVVSQKSEIFPMWRGKGLGKKALETREAVVKKAGCNLLLATVRNDNLVEIHLLESHGWKRYNTRDTGVSLWGKEL